MVTKNAEFLKTVPLFQNLDEPDLEALAGIAQEYEYPDRSVVAYQRDVADRLYIVRSGRLESYALDDTGQVVLERDYLPGDCFEDVWLFQPDAHPTTIKAVGVTRLVLVKGSDFLQLLEERPGLLDALAPEAEAEGIEGQVAVSGLTHQAWETVEGSQAGAEARERKALSLLPEEMVVYRARRTRWLWLLKALVPALLALLSPVLILFVLFPSSGGGLVSPLKIIVALIPTILFGLVVAFQTMDWSNDYFLITSKHLVHHEFNLRTFRSTITKTPIDQIQSVEVVKPNLLATVLNVGTTRITTAAQKGAIYFDYIADPDLVKQRLNEVRARVQAVDAGRAQATLRQSLEEHFHVPPASALVTEEEEGEEQETEAPARRPLLARLRRAVSYRYVADGTVTYRKHAFVLLVQIKWPLLLGGLLLLLILLLPLVQLVLLYLPLSLIDLVWFVWQFEDWRNDTYQVTGRFVIDIDRRPFGFGESRKQAELGNIQNVRADKPGLLATLFNYGSVVVETAGATSDIVFEQVANPNLVQSDIFQRRDQYRQQQRLAEGEQRRKEYAVLLDVYKQATEQGRIPNRSVRP